MVSGAGGGATAPAGGGAGAVVKLPSYMLGAGAVWGGVWLSPSHIAPSVGGVDKLIPFCFILCGVVLGMSRGARKVPYFSSIWNLTPAYQGHAKVREGWRHLTGVDLGAAAARGAAGVHSTALTGGVGAVM